MLGVAKAQNSAACRYRSTLRYTVTLNEGRPCWNSPDSVSLTSLLYNRHTGTEPLTKTQRFALGGNSGGNFRAEKTPKTAYLLASQAEFGCALGPPTDRSRRAESIKFQPAWADRGDTLALKPTWCKGGRAREIPIRTDAQRKLLTEATAFAGSGSLIQADRKYVEQPRRFEHQCQ